MRKLLSVGSLCLILALLFGHSYAGDRELIASIQEQVVKVDLGAEGAGTGVLVTRKVGTDNISFVWTAGHVIEHVRKVDKDGKVSFGPISVTQKISQQNKHVGDVSLEARVVVYSPRLIGHDLALLEIVKRNTLVANTKFAAEDVKIGDKLMHLGYMLGLDGYPSYSEGIVSKSDISIDNNYQAIQTTLTVERGSSGGGAYLVEGEHKGEHVGTIVKMAPLGNLNIIVPVSRMRTYATKVGVQWAIDEGIEVPNDEERAKIKQEEEQSIQLLSPNIFKINVPLQP